MPPSSALMQLQPWPNFPESASSSPSTTHTPTTAGHRPPPRVPSGSSPPPSEPGRVEVQVHPACSDTLGETERAGQELTHRQELNYSVNPNEAHGQIDDMATSNRRGLSSLEGLELPITPGMAARLKDAQSKSGLSFKALGERLGIKASSVHDMCSGVTTSSKHLLPLAKMLGLDYLDTLPVDDELRDALRAIQEIRLAGGDSAEVVRDLQAMARVEKRKAAERASVPVPIAPAIYITPPAGTRMPAVPPPPPATPPIPGKPKTRGSSG